MSVLHRSLPRASDGEAGSGNREPSVLRFGPTERFAHWWTVLMVSTALLSGTAIGDESRWGLALGVHVTAVALMAMGLLAAILFGDRDGLLRASRQLFGFDPRDVSWLRRRLQHPFQRHQDPAWGMFNTGQKVLAWCLSLSMLGVIVTGVLAWSAGDGEGGLHGAAVVLTALLLGAHIFMAVVNPATRPALAGMVFGRVRHSWAAKHHGAWLDGMSHPRS